MKINLFQSITIAALAGVLFLSGCASTDEEGHSLSFSERWKKMGENEDARAAAFVAQD